MRNLRKTRKRGGFNYIQGLYNCGLNVTKKGKVTKVSGSKCYKNFAEENNFLIVETADNGNCFYDTLSKYGARTGNKKVNKTHMQLREEIIRSMMKPERLEELAPFFVENVTVAPEARGIEVDPVKELTKFLKPYQWAGWMGDVIPQIAAQVLGINITIYDVRETYNNNDGIPNRIDQLIFSGGGNGLPSVNMLRTNGSHFRLLWPKDAPVVPGGRKAAPKVTGNALAANLGKMKLANKTAAAAAGPGKAPSRSPSRSPERGRATGYALRSRTNKKPAAAAPSRSPSPPKRRTARAPKKTQANLEAEALQAAIAASLANQHRPIRRPGTPLPNNFYNMLASFEEK